MHRASIENPLNQPVTVDPVLDEPWSARQRGPREWVQTPGDRPWAEWHAPKIVPTAMLTTMPMPAPATPAVVANSPATETPKAEIPAQPPKESHERNESYERELEQQVAKLEQELTTLRAELAARPIVRTYQLYDLGSEELELIAPLVIVLEEYPGRYVARLPEFEAVGIGEFEGEAVSRLKGDIVTLYRDLEREPRENLDEITLRWRKVLRSLIRKAP